jgi:hypothetical protein
MGDKKIYIIYGNKAPMQTEGMDFAVAELKVV